MKTLQQIKTEFARSKGREGWIDILIGDLSTLVELENELLILVQKECLKKAEQNEFEANSWGSHSDITDENNIIR